MAKASKSKQPLPNSNRPNLWGMIQNICVAAINKGQMPIIVSGVIIVVIILKMNPSDVKELAIKLLALFEHFHILGWILSIVLLIAWLFSFRMLKNSHTREVKRLTELKDEIFSIKE